MVKILISLAMATINREFTCMQHFNFTDHNRINFSLFSHIHNPQLWYFYHWVKLFPLSRFYHYASKIRRIHAKKNNVKMINIKRNYMTRETYMHSVAFDLIHFEHSSFQHIVRLFCNLMVKMPLVLFIGTINTEFT